MDEIERLKRGDFTSEEFQNLCHHLDENPNCKSCDFYDGCHDYQKKLFGISERELMKEAIVKLTEEINILRNDLEKVNEFARSLGWGQGDLDDDLAGCIKKSFDNMK